MTPTEAQRLIPGPDPGACPDCGEWRKAGLVHNCTEAQRLSEQASIDDVAQWAIKRGEMLAKGDPIVMGGVFGDQDWVRAYVLARQLAEAERENERLAEDRDYWKRQAHHLLKASMAGRRLRKLLREMGR